jgi:hypothetical protein
MEWKWTHGGPYVKSKRQHNSNNAANNSRNDDINNDINDARFNKEIEKSAYTTALNHDENTWDILNNIQSQNQTSGLTDFRQVNKREDTDKKMAERDLMCQVSMNPYLTTNNYLDDISNRDSFLKPQATNWDREKKKEENN